MCGFIVYFADILLLFTDGFVLDDVVWFSDFGLMFDFVRWYGDTGVFLIGGCGCLLVTWCCCLC